MPRTVTIDLTGVPPVSGGQRDHVAPGRYRLAVINVDDSTSSTGKQMYKCQYKVSAGPEAGSNLGDNWVMVTNDGAPNKIGLGQLHHFLLCLGLNVQQKKFALDLDRLSGREFEAEVADELYTPNNGQPRLTSKIVSYHRLTPENGTAATPAAPATPVAAAPVAPTPPPAPAPVAAPPAPAPVAVAEPEVASLPEDVTAEVAADVDDLFA